MKLHTLCGCLIAMLLVSGTTFGEIIADPCSTGTSSSASVTAGPGNPSPDPEYQDVWYFEYTDEAGTFSWEIYAYAYAFCSAKEIGGSALAVASASGAATSPFDTVSAYASMSQSNGTDYDVDSDSGNGSNYFNAYQGVSGMCDSFAYASIEEGSESGARAYATSDGYPNMW